MFYIFRVLQKQFCMEISQAQRENHFTSSVFHIFLDDIIVFFPSED